MLVLSRKPDETIVIGANILLRVLSIKGNAVQLGIEAPLEVPIRRAELAPGPRSHAPIDVVQEEAKRSA
jgi:carbon storage regulator